MKNESNATMNGKFFYSIVYNQPLAEYKFVMLFCVSVQEQVCYIISYLTSP